MGHSYDVDYYHGRERQQRALAARASDPDLARFHLELAERYARLGAELAESARPRAAAEFR